MFDLEGHLTRQIVFSTATFGPGKRTKGVIDHIRKELVELEATSGSPAEWVDVVILALDGLTRACKAEHVDYPAEAAASAAVGFILRKQQRNELRTWPDWRTAPLDKAIEHVRGQYD